MAEPTSPNPLVPPEVDLRDFGFMPLDVARLRDSDLASVEDAEIFRCGVLSWCVSWHQIPAASLPDDDVLLTRLLGFGRDVKGWKRIRAAGGLHGWVVCNDGRLYHPVVAEKAAEAWTGKLAQRWRTEAARVKKHNQRHRLDGPDATQMPEFEDWRAMGCPQGQPLHVPGTDSPSPEGRPSNVPTHVPRETASKGQGEGQGEGQGQGQGDLVLSLLPSVEDSGPAPSAPPPTPPAPPPEFDGNNAEGIHAKAIVLLAMAFDLPEPWGVDAEKLGFKPSEVIREAERFRQYWTVGKGAGARRTVKGWRQTWSNWLAKAGKDVR